MVRLGLEIPQNQKEAIDNIAKTTGWKKNLIIRAAIHVFIELPPEERERTVKEYLSRERRDCDELGD
jgi:predicted transcriptional regulator